MIARKLVRIVYYKSKNCYLITPCITIKKRTYGYLLPVTKLGSDASLETLYNAIIIVMNTDCRMADSDEVSLFEYTKNQSIFFYGREFKKEFGYHYGSLVKTATSIIMMEQLPDGAYVFEMWSTDGMEREHITCPAGSSREEVIETLGKALKQSEANRAARPKYY